MLFGESEISGYGVGAVLLLYTISASGCPGGRKAEGGGQTDSSWELGQQSAPTPPLTPRQHHNAD